MNGQPAWQYSDTRKQFYYSLFDKPHLNFRNENVTKKFSDVISKFLNLGAAGIRVRNAPYLLVDSEFKNESIASTTKDYDLKDYNFYRHTQTKNLPELGALLKTWRDEVRNKTEDGPFMVSEELPNTQVYRYKTVLQVDAPVVAHVFSKASIVPDDVVNNLNHVFDIENVKWPLWVVSYKK